MRVFIAEKPSLGRAIAAVLPGPQQREKNHIISGEANAVVWCAGHILEQYYPEDYDANLKKWTLDSLPIEPAVWQLAVVPRTKDLYSTIKRFAKAATMIVHAGDPDREGQLLVDEVLVKLGIDVPVKRLLISDMNPAAVKKALTRLENNSDYTGLRDAALGRSRADWLFGLNLTRLYTLQGQAGGHSGVLSVGRVQTPVLGLVVRRDLEIDAFTSKPYYTLTATIVTRNGHFIARWVPGKNAEDHQDEEGRVVNRAFAEGMADQIAGNPGEIVSVRTQHKKEAPPLPFSLPELQKLAARGRGLSPKKTLTIAQSLYEKHQIITYPRSDCPYLPLDHWSEAAEVRDAIAQSVGPGHKLAPMTDAVNLIHRGKCWNDTKITAHHAIIPTKKWIPLDRLTADERWVYEQVALRYLLQFCVDRAYDQTDVSLSVAATDANEAFKARGRVETEAGWTAYRGVLSSNRGGPRAEESEEDETTCLPALTEGEAVRCDACERVEKNTTPPQRFTEATLLDAMTRISRFVEDPVIKKTLKETDGLGTPATQATIIDTLFLRGFLEKQKKQVFSTALGKDLIHALPTPVTLPDMTALWEQQLARVESNALALSHFMAEVSAYTRRLIEEGKAQGGLTLAEPASRAKKKASAQPACPGAGCDGHLRRIKGKKGFFWGCTNFGGGCKETRPDSKGKPARAARSTRKSATGAKKTSAAANVGEKCPDCKKGVIQIRALKTGKNPGKSFKGCTGFPSCKYFAWPDAHQQEGSAP